MAGLSITGQMKVQTLQTGFIKEFGLTLRVYDGRAFADPNVSLSQVRKKKGSGKGLSVAKNMKVGTLEEKFEEEFGLKVQVAGSDDSYLCDNNLTLNAAQQADMKKLDRKTLKAATQNDRNQDSGEAQNDSDIDETGPNQDPPINDVQDDENAKEYFINCDKPRDACSIIWESDDYDIKALEPYIYAIQCDDGEDFHELINAEWPEADGQDDFKTIQLNDFEAVDGNDENEYILCFNALVSIDLDNHPTFQEALEKADNQIFARIQFKKDGKPIVDEDGYQEHLYEMTDDVPVDLESDDDFEEW